MAKIDLAAFSPQETYSHDACGVGSSVSPLRPSRLFHCDCLLQELRRGADPARIYSIAFAKGDAPEWLAMSSDKGTVHVFKLSMGDIKVLPLDKLPTATFVCGGRPVLA